MTVKCYDEFHLKHKGVSKMSLYDMVKDNYYAGKVSLEGTILSDEFTSSKLVQTAHSVPAPLVVPRNDDRLVYSSVNKVTLAQSYTGQSPGGVQMKLEFMTDSSLFQIKTIALKGLYAIFVDGKLTNRVQHNAGEVTNEISWMEVRANEGVQRKMRHIEVYGVNMAIGAVVAQATDTVSANIPDRPFVYQVGDSYTFGTGAGYPGEAWGSNVAVNDFYAWSRALGFDGYAEGVGSSGWNSDGSQPDIPKTLTRFTGRMKNFNRKFDVISLAMGLNDASTINVVANQNRLRDNFNECMTEMRKNFPNTPAILISCATPLGLTANQVILNELLSGECGKYNIGVINVDNLINAANNSLYGTDDSDARTHPNAIGHQYRGLFIAKSILNAALNGTNLVPEIKPRGFTVTYIERLRFAVDVKREVVQAKTAEEAYWMVKSREYSNPDLRIEIISVA